VGWRECCCFVSTVPNTTPNINQSSRVALFRLNLYYLDGVLFARFLRFMRISLHFFWTSVAAGK
jgi:hypothetical protein